MKLLILGGSGHVSGTVARAALARGGRVWTLTRGRRPLPEGVVPLVADRRDTDAVDAAIGGAGVDWDLVIDCIAFEPADIRQDIALLRGRARRLAVVSTDFVYDPAHRRLPQPEESDRWADPGGYGGKKRLCEVELAASDLDWTVLRPCHIYGPTSELGCLPLHGRDPKLIERLRAGEPLRLLEAGRFLQQPLCAGDLAETLLSVAGNESASRRIFNVAGPDTVASVDYYRIVADVLGVGLAIEPVPAADHPDAAPFACDRVADLTKLQASGLHVPSTALAAGLREHVEGLLA